MTPTPRRAQPELRPDLAKLVAEANVRRSPARSSAASSTSRTARSAGETDEQLISAICEFYAAQGRALINKRPTPVKPLGSPDQRGSFRAVWLAPAGVDYAGVLLGGVAIMFEAKGSGDASLPLMRHGEPLLSPQQRQQLDQATALGAVTGLVVRVRRKPRGKLPEQLWYWIGWPEWQDAEAEAAADGRASIGLDLLEAHGKRCALVGRAPDFLAAIG